MGHRGEYTILYMPHIASEAELILNNLLPYLLHEYGEEVLMLFTEDTKKEAKDDK